jgi:hypothetical protein
VDQFPHGRADHHLCRLATLAQTFTELAMSGWHRKAAIAGEYNSLRIRALPILDKRVRPRILLHISPSPDVPQSG